jgi:hypothetical protein
MLVVLVGQVRKVRQVWKAVSVSMLVQVCVLVLVAGRLVGGKARLKVVELLLQRSDDLVLVRASLTT